MSEEEEPDQTIEFAQFEAPPLTAGEYKLTVEQTICSDDRADAFDGSQPITYSKVYSFAVYTERFQLHPELIVKVFPPDGSHGDYGAILPHVMLARSTLPWERSPNATGAGSDHVPWLALLLFDEDDQSVTPRAAANGPAQFTARDLLPGDVPLAGGGTGRLPADTVSCFPRGRKRADPLDYGESLDDPCQVIDVPVALWSRVAPRKEDLSWLAHTRTVKHGTGPEQSCAVVTANRTPTFHHTSTVHLVSLEGMEGYLPPATLTGVNYVRLISLQSWRFSTGEGRGSFAKVLESVNAPTPGQREPVDGLLRIPHGQAQDGYIKGMLDVGYTVLPYQTRTGQSTVSWYRGPLAPCPLPRTTGIPLESADAVMYVDKDRNVYDTSYGAAWQLGRLLALADRSFATALHHWKMDQMRETLRAAGSGLDPTQRATFYFGVTDRLRHPGRGNESTAAQSNLPDHLLAWLADLYLLRGVPFWYLVPDERMLPPESLRFFLVDNQWLACVIDGAMSLGRATRSAYEHDLRFAEQYFRQVQDAAAQQNKAPEADKTLSGFLLRSGAVKGWWPGIRADGFGPAGNGKRPLLKLLRLDRLSDSTLLVLFDGVVASVDIHEPLEGIHFRIPDDGKFVPRAGAPALDIDGWARKIPPQDGKVVTAADFARALVAPAGRVKFELTEGD
jgi:hypothetical protein